MYKIGEITYRSYPKSLMLKGVRDFFAIYL